MTEQRTFVLGGPDPKRRATNRQDMIDHIKSLDMDKRHRVEIKPYVRKRTNSQNGLYRKWVDVIAIETGNDNDDVHDVCLKKFCPMKTEKVLGEEIEKRSTTLLDTKEMSDFMTRVQAWAATDWGINLPLPEDQGR